MAEGLFFLMIGLVSALTIILLFCEYSCRGDVISKFDGDAEENVAEEEQVLTTSNNSNNNNGSQEEVDNMASSPNRRMSEGFERVSGRRSSVKLLQRQESTTSQAPIDTV